MARYECMKYYGKCNPCAQSHVTHHCSFHGRDKFLIIIGGETVEVKVKV